MWWAIWVLLLVLAGVYLGARTWGLWGQTKELGSELAIAEHRLTEVQSQLDLVGDRIGPADDLAVFASPRVAREKRARARAAGSQARQQRRAAASRRRPKT